MQITLSTQQSQILESLSQQGKYPALEDAINAALVLFADDIVQQNPEATPEYLAWIEQTRQKLEEGAQAAERGEVLDADVVIASLRAKVDAARTAGV